MAVPNFQELMLPLLQLAADGKSHEIGPATAQLADYLELSGADRSELLPSGNQTRFANRVAWARTHLKHAGLLETVTRGTFRNTPRGGEVLEAEPTAITVKTLQQFPEYLEFRARKLVSSQAATEQVDETPEERIESSYLPVRTALAEDLLDRVSAASPAFFERLDEDFFEGDLGSATAADEATA